THAFLYSSGQMRDLGTLGGSSSSGYAINDTRQVVGGAGISTPSVSHAFLYSNDQMYDLNNLIDPALGLMLSDARGINNHGQIVAEGYTSGNSFHAFLLTPVPEPSTWTLFGVALLGLAGWARGRKAL
ncbi:MAG: DUF3466 family protein, partial [Acidobacteriaceae bacterium]|nr:DUF3466 family protein [Acidobacteriaceae bacterium]